jgi:nitroreductase
MNVFDAIFSRRSTRSFKPDKVDDKLIGLMLHSAMHAPSAGNTQEWQFIVVKDDEVKKKIAAAALNQTFIAGAPVVIVVCVDKEKIKFRYGERGEALYAYQDTANATMLIMLTAEALGLSTCWVGAFDEEKLDYVLDLPTQIRPVVIIPVGYSDEIPLKPRRIPFEQLTWIDKYGKKYDIAYSVQQGDKGKEYKFKQIGNYIEDLFKQKVEERRAKPKERTTFAEFLKKLRK